MRTRRASRLVAGFGVCFALVLAAAPNRAADPKADVKWETRRATHPEDPAELKALQGRVTAVADKSAPTTVAILIGFGAGSGVIVSEDGLVLTAAHVIAGEPKFNKKTDYKSGLSCTIVLHDGTKVKGKTLGINTDMDSGMVKITDKGPLADGKWPFTPMAKAGDLKTGQWVVSLGHPGGPKTGRAPVARLGRVVNNTKEFVRSNCTLVGGDSGGPLFDLDGNVVGIHSRIGLTLADNIHVPTEWFKKDWDKFVAGEVVSNQPARVAVRVGVVFPDDETDDAWVSVVDDPSPASRAGLKPGDTITRFNDDPVKSVKQFRELLAKKKPGDVVKLTVRRGVEILTLSLTLEKKSDS